MATDRNSLIKPVLRNMQITMRISLIRLEVK